MGSFRPQSGIMQDAFALRNRPPFQCCGMAFGFLCCWISPAYVGVDFRLHFVSNEMMHDWCWRNQYASLSLHICHSVIFCTTRERRRNFNMSIINLYPKPTFQFSPIGGFDPTQPPRAMKLDLASRVPCLTHRRVILLKRLDTRQSTLTLHLEHSNFVSDPSGGAWTYGENAIRSPSSFSSLTIHVWCCRPRKISKYKALDSSSPKASLVFTLSLRAAPPDDFVVYPISNLQS